MNKRTIAIAAVVLAAAAFAAGYLLSPGTGRGGGGGGGGEREVLYYVDPMNPSFRSPEPGTAPCGMALEPVYADGSSGDAASDRGLITVRADRQQLIGVTTGTAVTAAVPHELRLLGTVAVDETRLYQISSVTQGWVREVTDATSGTFVRRSEVLAKYYSRDAYNPQQSFIYALNASDRQNESGQRPPEQGLPFERTTVNTTQALLNVGMTQEQIDRIAETREVDPLVEIRSPADGFILERNVFLGGAFQPTATLYTVADLSVVWILADAFETDERFLEPGVEATISHPALGDDLRAVVSHVLPEFSTATRTLKVRLEARNPGFALRPGMFVDVQVPVELGPALTVPRSAVLDSGSRSMVFVDQGEGLFEPRRVTTGWSYAGRVEILDGLAEGETVVTSGNFLLDSESRMRSAGADPLAATSVDPICGMDVEHARAEAKGLTSEHDGVTVYFCNPSCKETYDADPEAHPVDAP
ncbi:MAG TPA: efflux RND transporter periplasmic adaptor subunit [Candidatus Sulfomarinibacteraceae bacterium]|nr:efflux RND transporter periplasmic adaptor subunit [Candidatus Sulfomarinibacteraceae bacterium]